ncbi:7148_t:CDS:2 [Entrophospora sp. SA101]|nr:7148_t:CDS:2 [Entrophospora sp. SA101]
MLKEYEEYWTGFRKGQHNYQQQEILSNDDINQMNKEACAQFGEAFQECSKKMETLTPKVFRFAFP